MTEPAPRCEPPEHLLDRNGLHVLTDPEGEPDAGKWRGRDMGWWFGNHTSMDATSAHEMGYRYLHPVSPHDPADVEHLVIAAETARELLLLIALIILDNGGTHGVSGINYAARALIVALSPFKEPRR